MIRRLHEGLGIPADVLIREGRYRRADEPRFCHADEVGRSSVFTGDGNQLASHRSDSLSQQVNAIAVQFKPEFTSSC